MAGKLVLQLEDKYEIPDTQDPNPAARLLRLTLIIGPFI